MELLVYEDLNSFVRNQNPIKSLKLGYEAKIRTLFRQHDVPDSWYKVEENGEIIFNNSLYLNYLDIIDLPDNMVVKYNLDLRITKITKLPNNLKVLGNLYLGNTKIIKLPDDLTISGDIIVNKEQHELINYIKQSKFKDQLIIR